MHVLDIVENAIEAGASKVEVTIEEDLEQDRLTIDVQDNGRGMSQELIQRVMDPFCTTRTTRHVGLGLPLLAAAARRCDGDLSIESEPGRRTRVRAHFRHSHIDRAPLGDMAGAMLAVLLSERAVDLDYTHRVGGQEFRFNSVEIRKELEGVPLTHPRVRAWLSDALREGEVNLRQLSFEERGGVGRTMKEGLRWSD